MSDHIDVNEIGKREGQRIETVPTVTITRIELVKACAKVVAEGASTREIIAQQPLFTLLFSGFCAELVNELFPEKEDE